MATTSELALLKLQLNTDWPTEFIRAHQQHMQRAVAPGFDMNSEPIDDSFAEIQYDIAKLNEIEVATDTPLPRLGIL